MGNEESGPMKPRQEKSPILKREPVLDLTNQNITILKAKQVKKKIETLILNRNMLALLPLDLQIRVLKISMCVLNDSSPIFQQIMTYNRLKMIDMTGNRLTEIPSFMANMENLKYIMIGINRLGRITNLPAGLLGLDCSQNPSISELPELPGCLEELNCDYNNLTEIVREMPRIEKMSLVMNAIEHIDPCLTWPSLKVLNLQMNRLTKIPDFRRFAPGLVYLNISDNFIDEFPSLPLTLTCFIAKRNKLTEIPDEIVNFTNLDNLDVEFNQIKRIPKLPESLTTLNIGNNEVECFEPVSLPKLASALFSNNRLASLPPIDNHCIQEYFIHGNNIEQLECRYLFSGVHKIDASFNEINMISSEIFALENLRILCMQKNRIEFIPREVENSTLQTLNISLNPLQKLPDYLPMTLESLSAAYCGVSTIPDSYTLIPKLTDIVLCGNKIHTVPLFTSAKIMLFSRNEIWQVPDLGPVVEILDFSCNNIRKIPDELNNNKLIDADFSFNEVEEMSESLQNTKLKYFKVHDNPLDVQLAPQIFPLSLEILDITRTCVKFIEPPCSIKEIFVSEEMSSTLSWNNVRVVDYGGERCGFAEMRGSRPEMEDAIVVKMNIRPEIDLFAVFDGHGGSKTSLWASKTLHEFCKSNEVLLTPEWMMNAISHLGKMAAQKDYKDGSTVAIATLKYNCAALCHLGDTRILVLRDDGTVRFATNDHKPTSRVEIDRIHKEGGKIQRGRVGGVLAVARSLGDQVRGIGLMPDISMLRFKKGDKWLVIGCDGIFDVMTNEFIAELGVSATNARDFAYDLRNIAYANHSSDNISVICVDVSRRYKLHPVMPQSNTSPNMALNPVSLRRGKRIATIGQ